MQSAELFKVEFSRLLNECRIKNEFEFVNVLLGYKGMGDMMTLTHFYESESLFQELPLVMTGNPENKNNVRIGLFLYCHFFEMDELYRITGNLVNIANGQRFQPFLFDDLQEEELTPGEKLTKIREVAIKCGFEKLMISFDELYSNKLRNSFFHSNYSITEGEYANTSSRHEIIIKGVRKHRLNISSELMPLITACIDIANHFFSEISKTKASYTQSKLVIGTLSTPEPIAILGHPEKGLIGWESSSGSALKITDVSGTAYLAAFNMRVTMPNKKYRELDKRLQAFLQKDKNKANDPELAQLEKDILEFSNEELAKGLAVAYFNYGNNTKDLADKAISPFEKKSLLQHALSRYIKAISYDGDFVPSVFNKLLTEAEIKRLDGQSADEFAIFKEMEGVIQKNTDFPDTLYNVGFYAYLAANEAADQVTAKELYLKSAQYYLQFLNTFPDDHKAFYGIVLAYWHAAQLSEEPENRQFGDQAYLYFKKCISPENGDISHSWNFTSFLEYYAGLMETFKEAVVLLAEAVSLLDPLINNDPQNAVLYYKRGTKNMFAGHYSENATEREAFFNAARDDFEHSLNLKADDVKCMNNLGYCLIQLGKIYNDQRSMDLISEALNLMDKIILIDPEKIDSYQNKTAAFILLYQMEQDGQLLTKAEVCAARSNELKAGSADGQMEEINRLRS